MKDKVSGLSAKGIPVCYLDYTGEKATTYIDTAENEEKERSEDQGTECETDIERYLESTVPVTSLSGLTAL